MLPCSAYHCSHTLDSETRSRESLRHDFTLRAAAAWTHEPGADDAEATIGVLARRAWTRAVGVRPRLVGMLFEDPTVSAASAGVHKHHVTILRRMAHSDDDEDNDTTALDAAALLDLNSVTVSASELMEYIEKSQEGRNDPDSDPLMRQVAAAAEFAGKDFKKAGALYFRAVALAKVLTQCEGAPGWTIKGEDDSVFTNECVIVAAAAEPLTIVADEFGFDRETFLDRVLLLSAPDVPQQ